jgi:hypothetical protein
MRRSVGHDSLIVMPLRHALEAEAALQQVLGVVNFDVIARGPSGAVAAKMPLLAIRLPAINQQVFHARDIIESIFSFTSGEYLQCVNKFPELSYGLPRDFAPRKSRYLIQVFT